MALAYSLIVTKLWKGLKNEMEHNDTICYHKGEYDKRLELLESCFFSHQNLRTFVSK